MSMDESLPFRSPIAKLVRFFRGSRDKWKARCKDGQAGEQEPEVSLGEDDGEPESLEDRSTVAPEKRRRGNRRRLRSPSKNRARPGSRDKRPGPARLGVARGPLIWKSASPRQQFPLGVVAGSLALVLRTGTRLQRVADVLAMHWNWCGLDVPVASYYSVRLWLLRLGLYQLSRPKTPGRRLDVDHRSHDAVGRAKVPDHRGHPPVGLERQNIAFSSHEDVELIDLVPVTESNGNVVYQQLKAAAVKTGVPRAIISDGGQRSA